MCGGKKRKKKKREANRSVGSVRHARGQRGVGTVTGRPSHSGQKWTQRRGCGTRTRKSATVRVCEDDTKKVAGKRTRTRQRGCAPFCGINGRRKGHRLKKKHVTHMHRTPVGAHRNFSANFFGKRIFTRYGKMTRQRDRVICYGKFERGVRSVGLWTTASKREGETEEQSLLCVCWHF